MVRSQWERLWDLPIAERTYSQRFGNGISRCNDCFQPLDGQIPSSEISSNIEEAKRDRQLAQ